VETVVELPPDADVAVDVKVEVPDSEAELFDEPLTAKVPDQPV